MAAALLHEDIWFDRLSVEDAEYKFYEHIANKHAGLSVQTSSSLVNEIARARENIQSSLSTGVGLKVGVSTDGPAISARLNALEKENENLKKVTSDLQVLVTQLQARVTALEGGKPTTSLPKAPTPPQEQGEDEVDEDSDSSDDEDLFGDNEDRRKEAADLKQKMKDAEAAKKKKKQVIAKSSIILDVKPLGDDTDMELVKEKVTSIVQDGLVWGQSRLLPVAYGIKKLQITCVVEDDKVSVDDLETKIAEFDELVQSVDVVAFNKI